MAKKYRRHIKLTKELRNRVVREVVICSGPISCISISFEDGARIDFATHSYQLVPSNENPHK